MPEMSHKKENLTSLISLISLIRQRTAVCMWKQGLQNPLSTLVPSLLSPPDRWERMLISEDELISESLMNFENLRENGISSSVKGPINEALRW